MSDRISIATLRPDDLDSPVKGCARRVAVGTEGRFRWWVGVLRRTERPLWDIWYCHHQHGNAAEARDCVNDLIFALRGESDPIQLRNDGRAHV